MINETLVKIVDGHPVDRAESQAAMAAIMDGECTPAQIGAFLVALRMRGETVDQISGFAEAMRESCVRIRTKHPDVVDTCGTGGDALDTFNISTAAALVAAAAGVPVAKHGNRSVSSKCGSADVLEALGVKIDASAQSVAACIEKARIGFMFAPVFHPAMKHVQPTRKGLGFRTVFNILGPLANPAGAKRQVLGVADENLMQLVAEALVLLGAEYAMVVHAEGMDEISISSATKVLELKDGRILARTLDPGDLGIAVAAVDVLKVPDARASAELIRRIVEGRQTGPARDIVVLNAAAGIIVAGLAEDFGAAIELAGAAIDRGDAAGCLEMLIECSNRP